MEQVRHAIAGMPAASDVERRNRALVAFTLLTRARDSAIASMKLKHVDLAAGIHGPAGPRRPERGDVGELARAVARELRKAGAVG